MIADFCETDFIELFLDLPTYIGEKQGGELVFNREYDNHMSVTAYFSIYGEMVDLSISYKKCQVIIAFSSHVDQIKLKSGIVQLYYHSKKKAELMLEPYLSLSVHEV